MPRNLSLGDVLGRYRLDREIGRGGMGVVYLTHDIQLDRPVALKVINPDIVDDEQFRTRFTREMRIAAQIEHPNIVPVYEAGEIDGLLYIAMRYVEGEDLRTLLRRDGALGVQRAADLAVQLGAALDAAHGRGLVHRDVKPANVLIGGTPGEPHVYLSDFGLAREAASDSGLTNTGNWMGTIDYVAPEQLDGGLISARSDIYAMGCVVFEMVTGAVPFTGTIARKLYAHSHESLPSVGASGGRFTARLDAVLARASAKDPQDRYASAGDLGRAVVGTVHDQPISEERSVATGAALSGIATQVLPKPEPPSHTVMDGLARTPRDGDGEPPDQGRSRTRMAVAAGVIATLVLGAAVLAAVLTNSGDSSAKDSANAPPATTPHATTAAAATPTTTAAPDRVTVHITAPADGSVIDASHILLRGTVDPPDANVEVQGKPAVVGNGVFRADARLDAGTNTIDVIASSAGAAPTSESVVVKRKSRRPAARPNPTATPADAVPSSTRTFHVPSGNVSCEVSASTAYCAVAKAEMTFTLGADAGSTQNGLSLPRGAGELVDWGGTVTVGDVTCSVPPLNQPRGITCVNASTGHGFEASAVAARQRTY